MEEERKFEHKSFEEIKKMFKPSEKVILFTIGRMNPPTSGHMKLIKTIIEEAVDLNKEKINAQVAIILSHSHQEKVDDEGFDANPLICQDEKRALVNEMIEYLKSQMIQENKDNAEYIHSIKPIIKCMDDEKGKVNYKGEKITLGPGASVSALNEEYKPNHMVLILGQDRDTDFNFLRVIRQKGIPRIMEGPNKSMSATKMRNFVKANDKDGFVENMKPTGLSSERIDELYELLRERLNVKLRSPPKKRETKKKISPGKDIKSSRVSRKKTTSPGKEKESILGKRKAVTTVKEDTEEKSGGFRKYRRSIRIRNRNRNRKTNRKNK